MAILPHLGVALKDGGYEKSLQQSELVMDLPFLSAVLLKKPPFVDLQNALFILRVFHTVSLVNRKLILYQVKDSNGLVLMEFTGLIMFPIILKQLAR